MPAHFTPETFRFLRALAKNNDRTWFEARRSTYESALKQPLHALIGEVNGQLAEFAPEHIRPPHKIAMRIFRDTRFSPDKRPYKSHLAAWWARQGLEKTSAAGFYLQVGPENCTVAAGVYAPEREDLLLLRSWLAEHHERFRRILNPLLSGSRHQPAMQPLAPNGLTRNPKGFPPEHPASDLLRARNWGVTTPLAPEDMLQPTVVEQIVTQFQRVVPLVEILNEPFLRRRTKQAHWP